MNVEEEKQIIYIPPIFDSFKSELCIDSPDFEQKLTIAVTNQSKLYLQYPAFSGMTSLKELPFHMDWLNEFFTPWNRQQLTHFRARLKETGLPKELLRIVQDYFDILPWENLIYLEPLITTLYFTRDDIFNEQVQSIMLFTSCPHWIAEYNYLQQGNMVDAILAMTP